MYFYRHWLNTEMFQNTADMVVAVGPLLIVFFNNKNIVFQVYNYYKLLLANVLSFLGYF